MSLAQPAIVSTVYPAKDYQNMNLGNLARSIGLTCVTYCPRQMSYVPVQQTYLPAVGPKNTQNASKGEQAKSKFYNSILPPEEDQIRVARRWYELSKASPKDINAWRERERVGYELYQMFSDYLDSCVASISIKYCITSEDQRAELQTEAKAVFFHVMQRWDPASDCSPSHLLSCWLAREVRAAAAELKNTCVVRVDQRFERDAFALQRAMGENRENELVAQRRWGPEKVHRLKKHLIDREIPNKEVRLDDTRGTADTGDDSDLHEVFAGEDDTVEMVERSDAHTVIAKVLGNLEPRAAFIVAARFGINITHPMSSEEVPCYDGSILPQSRLKISTPLTCDQLGTLLRGCRETVRGDFHEAMALLKNEFLAIPDLDLTAIQETA